MSWDVYLHCPDCGNASFDVNYTSNVWPMLQVVDFPLRELGEAEHKASVIIKILGPSLKKLRADPEKYRAMNPGNGFGDYDSMIEILLLPLLMACKNHPNHTFSVH